MKKIILLDYYQNQSPKYLTTILSLQINLINPQLHQPPQYFSLLQHPGNLQNTLQIIIKKIMTNQLNFINTYLISTNINFFKIVLQRQCLIRNIQVPLCLTHYIDIIDIFNKFYGKDYDNINSIAHYFRQVRNVDNLRLLRTIFLRIYQVVNVFNFQDIKKQQNIQNQEYAYFQLVGLPFSIRKGQIQKFFNQDIHQIEFLKQNDGKFSGKAIIKVKKSLKDTITKKNKQNIGSRYIEIYSLQEKQYQELSEKDKKQSKRQGKQRQYHKNHRERSRDRKSSDQEYGKICQNQDHIPVRIRGLPYSFPCSELEDLFGRYRPIRKSAKMGHKDNRRSGQAMILFPDKVYAQRSLQLDGKYIQGRYLEIKLAKAQQYNRFK